MFKKSKPVGTICDHKLEDLVYEILDLSNRLRAAAKDGMCKKFAVDLYFEGSPDQKKASIDFVETKDKIYNLLGHYDTRRAELRQYMESHKPEDFKTHRYDDYSGNPYPTGHKVIECGVREFFH